MPPGHCGDHAVNQPPRRDSDLAASAVDAYSTIEVSCRVEMIVVKPQEQTPQLGYTSVAASPGDDFHDHGLGHGDRAVRRDQLCEALVRLAPGRAVVFDPRGGVSQNHAASDGKTSSGISAIARAPRIAIASSLVIGCPAR